MWRGSPACSAEQQYLPSLAAPPPPPLPPPQTCTLDLCCLRPFVPKQPSGCERCEVWLRSCAFAQTRKNDLKLFYSLHPLILRICWFRCNDPARSGKKHEKKEKNTESIEAIVGKTKPPALCDITKGMTTLWDSCWLVLAPSVWRERSNTRMKKHIFFCSRL